MSWGRAQSLLGSFTRVAACAIGTATLLGGALGYLIARTLVRGD